MTNRAEAIFKKSGAVLQGHFLLTSGRHSPIYWEKLQVLQFPHYTEQLCGMIARHFRGQRVQVVAGPAIGGIVLAHEVARQLGVRGIFAERESTGLRTFRRGFRIDPGERVLVVDDILTTGGSVREVVTAVNEAGGEVIEVGYEMVHLEVEAYDNGTIDRVRFYRWDPTIGPGGDHVGIGYDYSAPFQWDFDTCILPPRWNQVWAWAQDTSGNVSTHKFIWLYRSYLQYLPVMHN